MRNVFIRFLQSFWENYLLSWTIASCLISFHLGGLKIEVGSARILRANGKKKLKPCPARSYGAGISRAYRSTLQAVFS